MSAQNILTCAITKGTPALWKTDWLNPDSKVLVDVAWLDGDIAAARAGSLEKSVPFSVVVDGGRLLHLRSVVLSMLTSYFVLVVTNIFHVFHCCNLDS